MSRQHFEILVTPDNLWFLERYLSLFDCIDLFPQDAISDESERGVPIFLHTDLGFTIESDIDRSKIQLRNRSKAHGWTRFTTEHALKFGDRIIIQRTSTRDFALSVISGSEAAAANANS